MRRDDSFVQALVDHGLIAPEAAAVVCDVDAAEEASADEKTAFYGAAADRFGEDLDTA